MKIFAHRGLSSLYPENTMVAFKEALNYQIDGIETDVQMTKDGKLVIFHDELLDRTTDGHGFLKDYTLEELRKLNANNHYDGYYQIPTLDELFELIKDEDIILNLELKNSIFEYPNLEQLVLNKINELDIKNKIIISSFNHNSLLKVRELDKEIKIGVLSADRIIEVANYVHSHGFNCYHPFFPTITPEIVKQAHDLGLEVNVWTVDEEIYKNLLEQYGVDTLMTNKCNIFTNHK